MCFVTRFENAADARSVNWPLVAVVEVVVVEVPVIVVVEAVFLLLLLFFKQAYHCLFLFIFVFSKHSS